MASGLGQEPEYDRIGEVISAVQLPLENVEFALEQYLLAHGQRLDTETRVLLAGVRDCVGRVVVSARRVSRDDRAGAAGVVLRPLVETPRRARMKDGLLSVVAMAGGIAAVLVWNFWRTIPTGGCSKPRVCRPPPMKRPRICARCRRT